ncbi:MAG: Flp pilus assembly protein CpaB [Pseudomonadota bacterium]
MRLLFLLILLAGMGIAGFAGYLILQQFGGYDARAAQLQSEIDDLRAKVVETTPVVIVTREVRYGTRLTEEDVKEVLFPADAIPENAFTSLESVLGETKDEQTAGRVAVRLMETGEVLMSTKVSGFGEDAGIASRLQVGERAFTLRVDVASGVSGFLRPGDLVDILWTGRSQQGTQTRLLLDGIPLIAIDQLTNEESNQPVVARTVTVGAPPNVIGVLAQAQATGKLQLALRGIGDDQKADGEVVVNQSDILQIEEAAESQKCFQTIRKGTEVTRLEVPCKN